MKEKSKAILGRVTPILVQNGVNYKYNKAKQIESHEYII